MLANIFIDEKQDIIAQIIENISTVSPDLLSFVGQMLIQDRNFNQAYEILSKIASNTDDLKLKAGYLSALAEKDIKAASDYFNTINFKLPELENERDVHELIEASLDNNRQGHKKREKKLIDKVEETKRGGKIFIPKVKDASKIRYPKNYDPENPGPMPDAERWLPKWQR
jgi:signal recognition particle subunit SRP72